MLPRAFKPTAGNPSRILVSFADGISEGVPLAAALAEGDVPSLADANDSTLYQLFAAGTKVSYRLMVGLSIVV